MPGHTFTIRCPRCQSPFSATLSQAGAEFKCSMCGKRLRIPDIPTVLPVSEESTKFEYRKPKPKRARKLAQEALSLVQKGNFHIARSMVEQAISLDQGYGLEFCYTLRAAICLELGDPRPEKAIEFYNYAITCESRKNWQDARNAYLESFASDEFFLWPANNLAWMVATAPDSRIRNGWEAIDFAKRACERAQWNCWTFINTLAAAYAAAGEFEMAIGWQKSALELAPNECRAELVAQLRHFEARRIYIDPRESANTEAEGPLRSISGRGTIAPNVPMRTKPASDKGGGKDTGGSDDVLKVLSTVATFLSAIKGGSAVGKASSTSTGSSVCQQCGGSGNESFFCPTCNGSGLSWEFGSGHRIHTPCPSCDGTRFGKCMMCNGTGRTG
jgi:hypothetical protein